MIANPGGRDDRLYEQVLVRADHRGGLAGLRNKPLATFDKRLPSARIYLFRLREEWGPEFLEASLERPFKRPFKAIGAVLRGEADATIVDPMVMRDYEALVPESKKRK